MTESVITRQEESPSPVSSPVSSAGKGALRRVPELLAPAGDWECARAAVENGADAIYFGLERFNARMRAANFTEADLPALMAWLHGRGVRGYVTFNTLVFTGELTAALDHLRSVIAAGVDGAIVQDVGICRLIRRLSPDFPIHTSTQMTVTGAAGVRFARRLGASRVVLARENSLAEIRSIQKAQAEQQATEVEGGKLSETVPLEIFVHGALCVAYSGQCLTSESLGGRSANRGECAQACRMPYELVSDGQTLDLGDRRYLLSPQDLAGIDVLEELVGTGAASLKIEGRLKSAEYVASITRVYRRALDRIAGENVAEDGAETSERYRLEMAFSRGLYPGWFNGIHNQELVHARFGKKRGVFLGTVRRIARDRVIVELEAPVRPGDGLVFDQGRPDVPEEGGRVYTVDCLGSGRGRQLNEKSGFERAEYALSFGDDALHLDRIAVGCRVWKTDDPVLNKELRQSFEGEQPRYRRPVTISVHGEVGMPLVICGRDEEGNVVRVQSDEVLKRADNQPLTSERLKEQLGRLGGTPYRLGELENGIVGSLILPIRELNRMRRDMVSELDARRTTPRRWSLNPVPQAGSWLEVIGEASEGSIVQSENSGEAVARDEGGGAVVDRECDRGELIVLVRDALQLDAVLKHRIRTVYCEYEDIKRYASAVDSVRSASDRDGFAREIWLAPPRITKPGEGWILDQVGRIASDGILVRNHDHLETFRGRRCRGDFSLNVANPGAAEYFIQHLGLERVTASYDLNVQQLSDLLVGAPPRWFEITLHQHMPMFHMEHCVFCAFLSKGRDYRDCGRPCDRHAVSLRDRVGQEHPLRADAGCRNTVFNARAQTGAEYLGMFVELGARHFRIEFVDESPEEVTRTLAAYESLLRGDMDGTDLWRELKLIRQLGVTRGQMDQVEQRRVVPKSRSH